MAARKILKGQELRDRLISGIQKLTETVSVTLGPKGSNVLINNPNSQPHVTNDGITVATAFNLQDEIENMAVNIVRSISSKTCQEAGDGTTTSIILANKMLQEGNKAIRNRWYSKDVDMSKFKKGMNKALEDVNSKIKAIATQVTDVEQIKNIATISANNDEKIGSMIADAYKQIGLKGVLAVEMSYAKNTTVEITNGYKVEKGFSDRMFVTDAKENIVLYKNAKVLICPKQLKFNDDLYKLFAECSKNKQPLLIVCDEVDSTIYKILHDSKESLKSCVIGCPGISNHKADIIEDFSIYVNAIITFDNNFLGNCDSFKAHNDKTLVNCGVNPDNDHRISERIEILRKRIDPKKPTFDASVLMDRIGFLEGKMATMFVGANSDIEKKELWDRIDDATKAVKASIEMGTVNGGGYTLNYLYEILYGNKINRSFDMGYNIVIDSLIEPVRCLCKNSNVRFKDVSEMMNNGFVYDAKNKKYIAKNENIILDPAKVLISAITNAVSVTSMILSSQTLLF